MEAFPLQTGIKQGCPLSLLLRERRWWNRIKNIALWVQEKTLTGGELGWGSDGGETLAYAIAGGTWIVWGQLQL